MISKLNVYGIKSIEVNGLPLHTVLIRGNYSIEKEEILNKAGIKFTLFQNNKMYIRYITTDYEAFKLYVNNLGRALKQIAQLKLEQKYQWVLFP
jgi:hypothetical protein